MTFGFWRLLHSKRYEATLWQWALRHAYPAGMSRSEIHDRLDHINVVRNRIAHHEPVHGLALGGTALDLAAVHVELLEIARLISPEVGRWIASASRVPRLLVERPSGVS